MPTGETLSENQHQPSTKYPPRGQKVAFQHDPLCTVGKMLEMGVPCPECKARSKSTYIDVELPDWCYDCEAYLSDCTATHN
jgi:hypothetical protein